MISVIVIRESPRGWLALTDGPGRAVAGVAVTVAAHLWRRNMVLSIVSGTVVGLLLANGVGPA